MSTSTSENRVLHTADYNNRFNAQAYLERIYSGVDVDPNVAPFSTFFIQNVVRILQDDQKHVGNKKALEFGGGPNLWPSFLLAQYVDSIRFCDYAQCNIDAISNWIKQKPNAFDWTKFFESILDAAGNSREKCVEWESRLRDALIQGGLSTCDVNDPHCPILSSEANTFDIIFSSLCLEAACLTIEIFNETIKRLIRLLKPGGLLLLAMVRNESFYYVDSRKFFCLPLDETKVKRALHETGDVEDIYINSSDTTVDNSKHNTVADYDGKMIISAYKKI